MRARPMLHTLPYFEKLFLDSIDPNVNIHNVEQATFYATMYLAFQGFICMLEGTMIFKQVLYQDKVKNREMTLLNREMTILRREMTILPGEWISKTTQKGSFFRN